MSTTLKKAVKSKPRATARRKPARSRNTALAARKTSFNRALDLEQRKKIAKKLNVAAFRSLLKRNSASTARHWETEE